MGIDQSQKKDVVLDKLSEVINRNALTRSSTMMSDQEISVLMATEKDATSWNTIRHSYEWVIVTTFFIILFLGAAGWTWNKRRNLEQRMKAHEAVEMENLDNSTEPSLQPGVMENRCNFRLTMSVRGALVVSYYWFYRENNVWKLGQEIWISVRIM